MVLSFTRRTDHYEDLCVATFVAAFLLVLKPLALLEGYLRPLTWDARLRAADLYLGLDGFTLARLFLRISWLRTLLAVSYAALPFAFALNWSLERSRQVLRAAVIGGLLALPLYLLVPACGPVYAFPGYPWHPEALSGLTYIAAVQPRNCFPSMHYAWALLLAMNARNKAWKSVLLGYSVLIGLATLCGEHYIVDLIAAVPFSFAVQSLAERSWHRQKSRGASRSQRVDDASRGKLALAHANANSTDESLFS
jgi:hypothetical protein